ncbi:MAG: ABC transporter ATP-binding protein [Candidatus Cloacimonetes bacterium]|nr:ABC transporter ATP-binding protein [Candidatus Cloacimonadota bacterium]
MLKVENLSLQKGNFSIHDLNFELLASKTHVLLGPSGSGKTLLLEAILGMNQVSGGTISLNASLLNNVSIESRSISYVPQDLSLFPHLNVRKNILYPLQFSKSKLDEDRLSRLCSILDIENLLTRSIQFLSGGEKQRVAIARSLMTENEVLILDEPFSSLHQELRQELWVQLKQIQKEFRLCIFMVTHDLNEALFLADQLYLILDGSLHKFSQSKKGLVYPNSKKALKFLGVRNFFSISKLDSSTDEIEICGCEVNLDINIQDSMNFELAVRSDDIEVSVTPYHTKESGFYFQAKIIEMFHMNHGTLIHVFNDKSSQNVEVFVANSQSRDLKLVKEENYYFYVNSNSLIFLN